MKREFDKFWVWWLFKEVVPENAVTQVQSTRPIEFCNVSLSSDQPCTAREDYLFLHLFRKIIDNSIRIDDLMSIDL